MAESEFDVNSPVEFEGMDDVVEQQFVLPNSSNVLLKLDRIKGSETKGGGFKQLEISPRLVEGIEIEGELKYKGSFASTFPMRVFYWVSPEKKEAGLNAPKESTRNWYKNKQYLVEFKKLMVACNLNVNDFLEDGKLKVDELITALDGQEVRGNVVRVEEEMVDPSTGERGKTGRFLNEVRYIKAVN